TSEGPRAGTTGGSTSAGVGGGPSGGSAACSAAAVRGASESPNAGSEADGGRGSGVPKLGSGGRAAGGGEAAGTAGPRRRTGGGRRSGRRGAGARARRGGRGGDRRCRGLRWTVGAWDGRSGHLLRAHRCIDALRQARAAFRRGAGNRGRRLRLGRKPQPPPEL